jgi:hypothetical protein
MIAALNVLFAPKRLPIALYVILDFIWKDKTRLIQLVWQNVLQESTPMVVMYVSFVQMNAHFVKQRLNAQCVKSITNSLLLNTITS